MRPALRVEDTDPELQTLEDELALGEQYLESILVLADGEAARAFVAMRTQAERFSASGFTALHRWAPIFALRGYRHTVTLQAVFDLGRARLVDGPTAAELRPYWERVHLLGHLTVLAAAAEPADWLAEMAQTFAWRAWTPSFPLVRERILRLAVRGGWASARFGLGVVAPYLQRLATGQPLHAFDAALGLVSIATVHAAERRAIGGELAAILRARESAGRDPVHRQVFAALARSTRLALEQPDDAQRIVLGRVHRGGLARAVDSDDDAAELDASGYYPAILAMAGLAPASAASLFPVEAEAPAPPWAPERAAETVARTRVAPPRAAPRWTN